MARVSRKRTVTRYQLQFINGSRPADVDEGDLPWETVQGHQYDTESEGWEACDEFDAAFDNRYTHRIIPVEVEPEKPEPPEPAMPKPVELNRQMREYRAQEAFSRVVLMLEDGLRLSQPRMHLDSLVELCEVHLASSGASVLTRRWRQRLDALRAEVETRGNLRLVK